MHIIPFQADHVLQLHLQKMQASKFDEINVPEYGMALEKCGGSYTAIVDGRPIACAGIVEQWAHRGLAWALLGEESGQHFVAITRAVKRMLAIAHYHRIEMHVNAEFPQAMRWAEMLGFEVESKMALFTPEGADAFMYVRLNPGLHNGRQIKPDGSGLLCAA